MKKVLALFAIVGVAITTCYFFPSFTQLSFDTRTASWPSGAVEQMVVVCVVPTEQEPDHVMVWMHSKVMTGTIDLYPVKNDIAGRWCRELAFSINDRDSGEFLDVQLHASRLTAKLSRVELWHPVDENEIACAVRTDDLDTGGSGGKYALNLRPTGNIPREQLPVRRLLDAGLFLQAIKGQAVYPSPPI